MESSSSKKSATLGKITDVLHQGGRSNRLGPVIVQFEHARADPSSCEGFRPSLTHTFSEERDDANLAGVRQVAKVKLKVKSNDLTYSTEAPAAKCIRPSPYMRTYLAIRDRRTGLSKLVEANAVTVGAVIKPPESVNDQVRMSVARSKLVEEHGAASKEVKEFDDPKESKKKLVQVFGQSKGQRMYSLSDRMAVEDEQLENKLRNAAMNVSEKAMAMPQQITVMDTAPPKNTSARTPGNVYDLDDFLSSEERDSLTEFASQFKKSYNLESKEDVQSAVESKFFYELSGALLADNLDNDECFGLALYVEAILKLLKKPAKDVSKGPVCLTSCVPMDVAKRIFHTFAIKDQNRLDNPGKDRAICYAVIMSLLISNYVVDFSLLIKSVRAKADHLKKLIAMGGATLASDALTGISSVVLRIPLASFDPDRLGRKSGKKK